jgi:hypothetical protein
MNSVLQPWLMEIPLRMQSTLILGLRGPDTHVCPNVKKIQRWMRGLAFVPGNPDNCKEFMTNIADLPSFEEKGPLAKELEFCSQHFYSHLMHALEVVAYCYPNGAERLEAFTLFHRMCDAMHLPVEQKMNFETRLGNREWPGGKQPTTFVDAVSLLDGEI